MWLAKWASKPSLMLPYYTKERPLIVNSSLLTQHLDFVGLQNEEIIIKFFSQALKLAEKK